MHGLTVESVTMHGFVRSAIMLSACILAGALIVLPFALQRSGSSGPYGLAIAAVICLLSGVFAEAAASALISSTPLGAMLIGMMVRMVLPLGVCVLILAMGQTGRQHLAFIFYLLGFYMVLLALETCLAVKRTSAHAASSKNVAR
jgi:hypothetical protein